MVRQIITEAFVHALIHRDYIVLGSEMHIDMYDDRIEIQSTGGMFEEMPVQECVKCFFSIVTWMWQIFMITRD